MANALINLTPVFVGLFVGWLLRYLKLLDEKSPAVILRIGFYVIAPAVIYESLSSVEYSNTFIAFPIYALLAGVSGYLIGWIISKKVSFSAARKPVIVMSCMFVNTIFALMFILAQYGIEHAYKVILFNIINLPLVYGFGHAIAAHSNPEKDNIKHTIKTVLISPPIWAVVLGFVANVLNWVPPMAVTSTVSAFSSLFVPLAALVIGLSVNLSKLELRDSFIVMAVRYLTSIVMALVVIYAFDFTGVDRIIALCIAAAPIGFSTLTFAHLENLDEEFAAKTLGLSFIISIIATTSVMAIYAA